MLSKIYLKTHEFMKTGIMTVFFLGFASGFPFALTASVLTIRLKEAGVAVGSIGLFVLVAMPYSFRFIWAPLIDSLKLPILQKVLGRRRGWLCLIQVLLIGAIFVFGAVDPSTQIYLCALAALAITFLSATQDIIVDAYRIERLDISLQGVGASFAVYGYRLGLYLSGIMPLIIAEHISWSAAYYISAGVMSMGIVATLLSKEPSIESVEDDSKFKGARDYLVKIFLAPLRDLMKINGMFYVFAFIILYTIGDAMAGIMTQVFLLDKGFSTLR